MGDLNVTFAVTVHVPATPNSLAACPEKSQMDARSESVGCHGNMPGEIQLPVVLPRKVKSSMCVSRCEPSFMEYVLIYTLLFSSMV